MTILCIDYGERKLGIAISRGFLAEPIAVLQNVSSSSVVEKLRGIVDREEVSEILVGLAEGTVADAQQRFGEDLQHAVNVPVKFVDETLSTKDAQAKAIEAGIPQKKRHEMEDAYAAAIILQNYLESQAGV
ncbi:hypothetical protein A2801_00675 [Candidatus Woesebacteria bacterium RIFCSPHIGHO2_01_FULL_41_10]|uniref:Putative pre-16S rRNA nuclease n=1 Tax=Candidatus Woesebacteria bacterium RIFCSPHIGHO2_01_FULL_41_10 TaxID=1802500 RepID=A0A1F7YPU5_9BACT|nr:MAG: hypothetical protein A2801_00675 [Candidatus Woesebacteria bacterium RIFCSPHIGHO2_01_FULL_41_10]